MKKYSFLLLIVFSFIACSKEDNLPNIIGKWTGTEVQTYTINQIVTNEVSIDFEIDFKENGEGTYKNSITNDPSEIHWVWDELEKKAWIIREVIVSNGDEFTSTTSFKIEKNTASEQNWLNQFTYTNTNNETVELFNRWTFSK